MKIVHNYMDIKRESESNRGTSHSLQVVQDRQKTKDEEIEVTLAFSNDAHQ